MRLKTLVLLTSALVLMFALVGSVSDSSAPGLASNSQSQEPAEDLAAADEPAATAEVPRFAVAPEPSGSRIDYVSATGRTLPLIPPHDLDDPTFWFNPHDPDESLIIGANKAGGDLDRAGVRTWTLDGEPLQKIRGIHANNVDLRDGFELDGEIIPIILATDRNEEAWGMRVFTIDTDPNSSTYLELYEITGANLRLPYEPYGGALYHSSESGNWYAFVSSREPPYRIDQFQLHGADGKVVLASTEPVRSIVRQPSENKHGGDRFHDVVEGIAADNATGTFFANEETYGLHQYSAEPSDGAQGHTMDLVRDLGGRIRPDGEGVAVIATGQSEGFVVAVGQNGWERSRYEVYDRMTYEHLKSFEIVGTPRDDGLGDVIGTDGIAAYFGYINEALPCGLFLVHHDNIEGSQSTFKMVPLERIFSDMDLPVEGCRD